MPLSLFEESMTLWLWMSGKRNVSVCRGHELANALYIIRINRLVMPDWSLKCTEDVNAIMAIHLPFRFVGLYKKVLYTTMLRVVCTIRMHCQTIRQNVHFPAILLNSFQSTIITYYNTILTMSKNSYNLFSFGDSSESIENISRRQYVSENFNSMFFFISPGLA